MSYEIYETHLLNRDGQTPLTELKSYEACVSGPGGSVIRLKLAAWDASVVYMKVKHTDANGDATAEFQDIPRAIDALRRISGALWENESQEIAEMRERAASVVERACALLDVAELPYGDTTLSVELRTTMLQLIDLATRPS